MELSPSERQEVLAIVAKSIVDEIRAEAGGDLSGIIILPMGAVSQMVGLSTKQLPVHLPITALAPGKHGVSLKAIQEKVAEKTTQPMAAKGGAK